MGGWCNGQHDILKHFYTISFNPFGSYYERHPSLWWLLFSFSDPVQIRQPRPTDSVASSTIYFLTNDPLWLVTHMETSRHIMSCAVMLLFIHDMSQLVTIKIIDSEPVWLVTASVSLCALNTRDLLTGILFIWIRFIFFRWVNSYRAGGFIAEIQPATGPGLPDRDVQSQSSSPLKSTVFTLQLGSISGGALRSDSPPHPPPPTPPTCSSEQCGLR